jgi:glycerol-3-phosphate O-acyltransferase
MIVPVMVSYDRMFEIRNLTTEMMSGKVNHPSSISITKSMSKFQRNKLGEVYVKFLEPMHIQSFLE